MARRRRGHATSCSTASAIGYGDDETDPEMYPDQIGAARRRASTRYAGHGTFIAGLVHQACPDADIVAWRIVRLRRTDRRVRPGQRPHRHRRARAALPRGSQDGHPIDVLSLSLGYYHETPEDALFDPTMYDILRRLGAAGDRRGLLGRQRRDRAPDLPGGLRALARRHGQPCRRDPDALPIVSVGALNPNGNTDALFSNAGPWVRAYVPAPR